VTGTQEPKTTPIDPLSAIAQELHRLGAETDTERAVTRTAPWVASLGIHVGLCVLVLLVAGTVRLAQQEDELPLIVADFDALAYEPVRDVGASQAEAEREMVQDKVEFESEPDLSERLTEIAVDPISFISSAASNAAVPRFAPRPAEGSVTFVGVQATNARRIVYVVDASGSLLGTLQVVVQELGRSLEALSPQQEFSIIFFQQDRALPVPPGRLIPATDREKLRALDWIDAAIVPNGSSNPLPALELALDLEPDVIFVLSDNITGGGEFEVDRADLLAMLDRLNPRDAGSGRRRTQINCIQFLDPDPLDTLAAIAAEHGGPRGYKFLDRQELGLAR
jgi:hypothetical protein